MPSTPPTPTPPPSAGPSTPRAQSTAARLYELQVRAFLEAAEQVDVDPDVIDDLLDGFPADALSDLEGDVAPDEEVRDVDVEGEDVPGPASADRDHGGSGSDEDGSEPDIDSADVADELSIYLQEGESLVPSLSARDIRPPWAFCGVCARWRACVSGVHLTLTSLLLSADRMDIPGGQTNEARPEGAR